MKKFSEILVCPKCGENLVAGGNSLVCKNNHCYDIAKEGYSIQTEAKQLVGFYKSVCKNSNF